MKHLPLLQLDTNINGTIESHIIYVDSTRHFIGTVTLSCERALTAYVRQLFVDSVFRRLGIGTMLMEECCRIARENNCKTLGLLLNKGNTEAQKFYEHLGFFCAYQYDNEDILMCLLL